MLTKGTSNDISNKTRLKNSLSQPPTVNENKKMPALKPDQDELIKLYHDVKKVQTLNAFKSCCKKFTALLGFENYSLCLKVASSVAQPKLFVITDFPQGWIESYTKQKLFSVDPIMLKADQFNQAYSWEEVGLFSEVDQILLDAAASFGITDGLSAPFFGFSGEIALFSVVVPERFNENTPNVINAKILLSWFTAAVFQKAMELFEHHFIDSNTTLTGREKDCLRLAADGLTACETARSLNIGETTVVHHLRNAGIKLEARRRLDTVTKALTSGALAYTWQDAANIDIEVL